MIEADRVEIDTADEEESRLLFNGNLEVFSVLFLL